MTAVAKAGAVVAHEAVECKRLNHTAHFHTKSWSYRFECPTCGKTRRYNTNFLGNRYTLVCDGTRIVRETTLIVGGRSPVEMTVTRFATAMEEPVDEVRLRAVHCARAQCVAVHDLDAPETPCQQCIDVATRILVSYSTMFGGI